MQTIKNLNQIKGGALLSTTESTATQEEIKRLFEEDRATFLLLYGEDYFTTSADTARDEVVYS